MTTNGFTERNDPSLVIVPDWSEFCQWARDGGYGEEDLDINNSRCLGLQESFMEELNQHDTNMTANGLTNQHDPIPTITPSPEGETVETVAGTVETGTETVVTPASGSRSRTSRLSATGATFALAAAAAMSGPMGLWDIGPTRSTGYYDRYAPPPKSKATKQRRSKNRAAKASRRRNRK